MGGLGPRYQDNTMKLSLFFPAFIIINSRAQIVWKYLCFWKSRSSLLLNYHQQQKRSLQYIFSGQNILIIIWVGENINQISSSSSLTIQNIWKKYLQKQYLIIIRRACCNIFLLSKISSAKEIGHDSLLSTKKTCSNIFYAI